MIQWHKCLDKARVSLIISIRIRPCENDKMQIPCLLSTRVPDILERIFNRERERERDKE